MSAIVCGCSSWMKVSRLALSTFCRKEKGAFRTCWESWAISLDAWSSGSPALSSACTRESPPSQPHFWPTMPS